MNSSTTRSSIELQQSLTRTWELLDGFNNMNRNFKRSSMVAPRLPKTIDGLIQLDKTKYMQSTLMSI